LKEGVTNSTEVGKKEKNNERFSIERGGGQGRKITNSKKHLKIANHLEGYLSQISNLRKKKTKGTK